MQHRGAVLHELQSKLLRADSIGSTEGTTKGVIKELGV